VGEEGRSGTPDTCCMYGDGNGVQGMVEGVGESSRQYFSIWLIMWASAIFSVRPPIPSYSFREPFALNFVTRLPVCKCSTVTISSTRARAPGIRGQHPLHGDHGASDVADGREGRWHLDPPPCLGPGLRRLLWRQRNLDRCFCQHRHGLQGRLSLPNSLSSRS
jgi:hypothetical protein